MRHLVSLCAGQLACTLATVALNGIKVRARTALNTRVRRALTLRFFTAHARVDVPTIARTDVQAELAALMGRGGNHNTLWQPVSTALGMLGAAAQLGTQAWVLTGALKGERDGAVMALITLGAEVVPLLRTLCGFSTKTGELGFRTTSLMVVALISV